MAAVGDEVARGDRATVPGGRHEAELRDDLSCDVAQSHQAACGATDPLDIFEQLSICIELAAGFMPGLPKSVARAITMGIARSTQETSTPSTLSSTSPVGSSLPVFEPTASTKFSEIGAPVPGTPSMATSPSYSTCPPGVGTVAKRGTRPSAPKDQR